MMLLLWVFLAVCSSALCGLYFNVQALLIGFGRKRWTVAGFLFGPLIWPMFVMKKRMQLHQLFGFNQLIFRA